MITLKNPTTNIERIIAKIDNDFNPDNSDWIPRVGAWCIDAMEIIKCTPTKKTIKELKVNNKIAYSCIPLNGNIKVYDKNGCIIKSFDEIKNSCNCSSSTGKVLQADISNTISVVANPSAKEGISIATQINGVHVGPVRDENGNVIDYDPYKYNVKEVFANNDLNSRNYVITGNGKQIELSFDTDIIKVEYEGIETYMSELCECELPVIPNNGLLIEALVYYCMYKMLCRGMKHPVFNLSASQYGTNPYFEWNKLKDKAKASVINDGVNEDVSKLWRSAFFISAFDPRR